MAANAIDFGEWLREKIDDSGMTYREIGRRAGFSHATISNIINGHRKPGIKFCRAIAKALVIPPDTVLRMAGLLPTMADFEGDLTFAELWDVVRNMSLEERIEVLAYAQMRYHRVKDKEAH